MGQQALLLMVDYICEVSTTAGMFTFVARNHFVLPALRAQADTLNVYFLARFFVSPRDEVHLRRSTRSLTCHMCALSTWVWDKINGSESKVCHHYMVAFYLCDSLRYGTHMQITKSKYTLKQSPQLASILLRYCAGGHTTAFTSLCPCGKYPNSSNSCK